MTGRGKYYYHRPSANPEVSIGISLSASPAQFDPASEQPLHLVVTARILRSPCPEKPITLATSLNPLHFISDRSFKNIVCTSPDSKPPKHIEIWPKYHFRALAIKNVRECWDFVTIHHGESLEVKHEVPRDAIRAAGVQNGERYKAEMTDMGLGTSWWMYGTLEEVGDVPFRRWSSKGVEEEEEEEGYHDEDKEGDDKYNGVPWLMGEDPSKLALVIEQGVTEFDIT